MKFPPPGRMIGGLHVQMAGQGNPAVVLEAGLAASSVSWALVRSRIAAFTTVVSYDRAGLGWSAGAVPHRTALEAAGGLAGLLDAAGVAGPYVLVGHSFGGLIVRLFQQRYPERTAGLVLVDPVVRAEWHEASRAKSHMLRRGATLSRRGAMLARVGVVGFALKMVMGGSLRLPQLLARASAGSGAGVADRLAGEVRKMPRELWTAIAQHWSQPQSFRAMAINLENLPESVGQVDERRWLEDLPLVVLSGGGAKAEHLRDAGLSARGEHVVVPDAGHWVQLDAPDAVVEAVGRVVGMVRADGAERRAVPLVDNS